MTHRSGPGAFEIELPAGWSHRSDVEGRPLVARPDAGRWRMVPSIDLAERTTTFDTVDEYGAAEVANLADQISGFRLLLSEPGPGDEIVGAAATLDLLISGVTEGCRSTFHQRHLLSGDGRVAVATAAAADVDWATAGPVLAASVRSLRVVP